MLEDNSLWQREKGDAELLSFQEYTRRCDGNLGITYPFSSSRGFSLSFFVTDQIGYFQNKKVLSFISFLHFSVTFLVGSGRFLCIFHCW